MGANTLWVLLFSPYQGEAGMEKRCEQGRLGDFSSACQLKSRSLIESRKRRMACGRCQSAGKTLVCSCCGAGRAVMDRYRGIDIPRSPFTFFAVIERKPMPLGLRPMALGFSEIL
jgi:hypothetical protein